MKVPAAVCLQALRLLEEKRMEQGLATSLSDWCERPTVPWPAAIVRAFVSGTPLERIAPPGAARLTDLLCQPCGRVTVRVWTWNAAGISHCNRHTAIQRAVDSSIV